MNKHTPSWIFLFVLLFIAAASGYNYLRNEKDMRGECVKIVPSICIGGRISNTVEIFSDGPTKYHLWFKGETTKSKEECVITQRVTEAQYNKWMMGE